MNRDPVNRSDNNTKRLKILHIIIGTAFGGATVMVRLLSQYQMRQGHEVYVLANDVPGAREEFIRHGIKLIDDKGIKGHISPLSDIFHLVYWISLIRKYNFDIVHTQTVKAGFMGRLAARIAGVKHILHSCHGYRLEGRFKYSIVKSIYLLIERILSGMTSIVVVQSKADFDTALRYKIAPEEKLRIVYNGIDISDYGGEAVPGAGRRFRNEIGAGDSDIVVGVVARLHKVKGHEYLIDAAACLLKAENTGIKFVFVGDGPYKDELDEKVKNSGIERHFLFLNHRDDIPEIMRGIDALVLPSLREGFPIVLLEAMAAAKPCITTDVGGSSEAVEDGITGFVVPPGDTDKLAGAINRFIADKTLMKEMGEQGRAKVKTKFTEEVMGRNIEGLYDYCLKKSTVQCCI